MADGSVRTPGSGETIASDDIGGVKWQRMKIAVGADGAAVDVQPPDADAKAASSIVSVEGMLWNGATHDRERGNLDGTALASAARTTTAISANITNHNARGIIVYLNVTAASGTGGLFVRVRGVDPVSGGTAILLDASNGVIATGTRSYELGPGGSTAGTNAGGYLVQRVAGALPRTFHIQVAHLDGSSYTYSVGYSLIV